MTREEIAAAVREAVSAEFTHKHDNDSIVNADWTEIQNAIADRVSAKLAHLTLDEKEAAQLRHHVADHSTTCSYSCSLIQRMIGEVRS